VYVLVWRCDLVALRCAYLLILVAAHVQSLCDDLYGQQLVSKDGAAIVNKVLARSCGEVRRPMDSIQPSREPYEDVVVRQPLRGYSFAGASGANTFPRSSP
jgi:hypothetical protein